MIKTYPKKINNCNHCKYKTTENGVSVCRLFRYTEPTINRNNKIHYYATTDDCRLDDELCGKYGYYFKPIESTTLSP